MRWDALGDAAWNKNYDAAVKFYKKNGHLNMSNKYKTESGRNLVQWVEKQRKNRSNPNIDTVLDDSRIERLNQIGMVWDKRERKAAAK